jgi:hypothetical protein
MSAAQTVLVGAGLVIILVIAAVLARVWLKRQRYRRELISYLRRTGQIDLAPGVGVWTVGGFGGGIASGGFDGGFDGGSCGGGGCGGGGGC